MTGAPPAFVDAIDLYLSSTIGRSEHTIKAYRSDLALIAAYVAEHLGTPVADITVTQALSQEVIQAAFARFRAPGDRAPRSYASVSRCWSTCNGLCTYLVRRGMIDTNPMALIERRAHHTPPPAPPKAIDHDDLERMLFQLATPDPDDPHNWRERDLAIILAGALTGMRASELIGLNMSSFSPVGKNSSALSIQVLGKGNKYRILTAEKELVEVFELYLASRAARFPESIPRSRRHRRSLWDRFGDDAPFFVGSSGGRITRGTLQYRTQRAFKRAGITRTPGANTHRLRHSFAIYLADQSVPVHTLAQLLGHSTLNTAMRYLEASGKATRAATSVNPVYDSLRTASYRHTPQQRP